jgi:hypothetical protein
MSLSDHSKSFFRFAGLSLFGALLIYQIVVAAGKGLADVYALPTMNFLLEIHDRHLELAEEDRQVVEINLNRALALAPDNPDYLSSLGWLQQIRLRQEQDTLDPVEKVQIETLAYQSYAQASAQRPTWPYDWGDLALEQYRQANFSGASYHRALVNAARFGPWKDDIQVIITELALDTWDDLNLAARQALLMTIDRGLQRQPDTIIAIIEAYPAWTTVCAPGQGGSASFADLPHLLAECQRRLSVEPDGSSIGI